MNLGSPRILLLILAFLLLTDISRPVAQDYLVAMPVFGPEVFSREEGAVTSAVKDFAVPQPALLYQMQVQNGSPQGENLVAYAVVTLNGAIILQQKDFKQSGQNFQIPVILQPNNLLEVKLNGMPASYLTISIDGLYYPSEVHDEGGNVTENKGDCEDGDATNDLLEKY